MGIHANMALVLGRFARRSGFTGSVCTLGVQDVATGTTQRELFSSLGFSSFETLDVSAYEGAKHIFDLNSPDLPTHLVGRFDAVLNGGTIEHVFHIPNALTSMTRMLRAGGHAIHIIPCAGWADHGFVQIGPTLLFDYYAAAGFDRFESALCSFDLDSPDSWVIRPIAPGDLGSGNCGALASGVHLYAFSARKTEHAIENPIPTQRCYAATPNIILPRWFRPFHAVGGRAIDDVQEIQIRADAIQHDTGHCWTVALPELAASADDSAHPVHSSLILLEHSLGIGPAHAAHDSIRNVGRGAFSHWNSALYFSTSDNSDPRENGRDYSVMIPG